MEFRAQLSERAHERWGKTMEHDIYVTGLETFKFETGTRTEWGGAEQLAVFAHIHKIRVDIHAYGMAEQVCDGGGTEQEVIRVLFSNSTKRGNQPNHYDLLMPRVEAERPPIIIQDGEDGRKGDDGHGKELDRGRVFRQKLGYAKNKDECEDGTRITTISVSGSQFDFEYVLDKSR
eukprot:585612-Heterocapsa_arctica.AAC.1